MSLKKDILWRVAIVYLAVLILAVLIIGRVVYLQFFEAGKWKEKRNKEVIRNVEVEANRGTIRANDGRTLAISVPFYEIRIDFLSNALNKDVINRNIDSLSLCLSNLFKDKSPYAYKKELLNARKKRNRYYLLKRRVSYEELQKMRKFPIFRRGQYKGGFIYIKRNRRIKPHGILAGRTIGYTTRGDYGNIVGIEGAYEPYLHGVEGVRLMRRAPGNVWIPINDDNEIDPQDGKDVITTIDVNIQDVAESALYRQLKKHDAQYGTAVLMEVETGKVKAIANLKRNEEGDFEESYNYAVGQSIEPGSTFKLPALMAALEDGFVDLDDTVHTGNGKIKYYDHIVEDTKKGGYGVLTVKRAFEVSSNVGISKIITKYYKGREKRFVDRLYSMNLNEKLGIEIKGEGKPQIKYPGDRLWSGLSLPMMSFGYEVKLTPLQLLTFYNAVANKGEMVKPLFVEEIRAHGNTIKRYAPQVINPSICSYSTIKKAKEMLQGVVENGTAENLKNEEFKIAGKTGTAQIANEKYGYEVDSKISYIASFVGYFPAEDPKYSCIVVVSAPSKNVYYGNLVAGPVFKEIANKLYATSSDLQPVITTNPNVVKEDPPYTKTGFKKELDKTLDFLGINYDDESITSDWVVTVKKKDKIEYLNINMINSVVPSVKGMGAKDAVYLLENAGLDVELRGRGTVLEQSIEPGAKIRRGSRIVLTMSII